MLENKQKDLPDKKAIFSRSRDWMWTAWMPSGLQPPARYCRQAKPFYQPFYEIISYCEAASKNGIRTLHNQWLYLRCGIVNVYKLYKTQNKCVLSSFLVQICQGYYLMCYYL